MTRRVRIDSDGTPLGTVVTVDGTVLPVLGVTIGLAEQPTVTIVLDAQNVDFDLVTAPEVCGAVHPVAGVVCTLSPHGDGVGHTADGYVWRSS